MAQCHGIPGRLGWNFWCPSWSVPCGKIHRDDDNGVTTWSNLVHRRPFCGGEKAELTHSSFYIRGLLLTHIQQTFISA